MKNILKSLTCIMVLFLSSCDTETTGNVSSVTNYPVFEYNDFAVIEKGSTFSGGATATEGGADLPVTVTSNLDVDNPGVYDVTYSAVNSDGFTANVNQTVVVYDPSIIASDVTGCYHDTGRPERVGCITLVEGTTNIFLASDFGFGGTFPVYFMMDGDTILEIPQTYAFGQSSVALTYDPVDGIFTTDISPAGFSYTFQYD
ncbi:immunoglobulin-like domain-containing protein [Mariniflexile sp. HMF6888]|uniref:immunoglobulin-like domain-containing protein n=1 Tax=Mariniflexile sp. HMF6888 TaxID=3373086 RepID=UPI0037A7988A